MSQCVSLWSQLYYQADDTCIEAFDLCLLFNKNELHEYSSQEGGRIFFCMSIMNQTFEYQLSPHEEIYDESKLQTTFWFKIDDDQLLLSLLIVVNCVVLLNYMPHITQGGP